MKHSIPLLLLCFACSGAPETVDSSDLKEVTPKTKSAKLEKLPQPSVDPDDEALLNDDRDHLTQPIGARIQPIAVAALLADGLGDWSLGAAPRTTESPDLELVRYVRRCNKVTGCTPWEAEVTVLLHKLQLSFDPAGALTLTQTDLDNHVLTQAQLTDSKTPVTLIAHLYEEEVDTRRFLVELRDGSISFETLVRERDTDGVTEQWGWSMQFNNDVNTQPARPAMQAAPTAQHTITCNESAATWDQLVAWFSAGEVSVDFPNAENFSWSRQCYVLTGCSEWSKDEHAALLHKLVVVDDKIAVKSSRDQQFTLANSAFKASGTDITVGPSCARGFASYTQPGAHHNLLDVFESGVSQRGAGPGGN